MGGANIEKNIEYFMNFAFLVVLLIGMDYKI